jgi:cell division protein FtsA
MFWGRPPQPTRKYNLVLDIGTGLIKALLVFEEDRELHVAGKAFVKPKTDSIRGGLIYDLEAVSRACREAIDKVFAQAGVQVPSVIFGVSGQLVESVTTTVHYDRAHPEQPLSSAELKNIIYRIIERSNEKLRLALRDKFNDEHPDIELIHAAVVESQLDGYTIPNPVGFQGKRLSLTIFNAYIPLVYASVLQNLAKDLNLSIASIAAQPYGVSKIFADTPNRKEADNAIFIDIGHSATDLVVVKNGNVEGVQSFVVGGEDITRAIMKDQKISHTRAEEMKRDYVAGTLSTRQTAQVAEAIKPTVHLWRDGVRLSLAEFTDLKMLSPTIYLAGGGAALPEMKKTLHTKNWWVELPFTKNPKATVIHPDMLEEVVDETDSEWSEIDVPPLGLAKLTLDLTSKKDAVMEALHSIIRSIRQ